MPGAYNFPVPPPLRPDDRERELHARYLTRERRKMLGLLAIVVIILVVTLLLFGRSIPWSAR
jgi:hypothetical protein